MYRVCVCGSGWRVLPSERFSQIKDLDCEILDYATERHIRGSFLPSFESSRVFGQCQQALISQVKKGKGNAQKAALCFVNFNDEWTNQSCNFCGNFNSTKLYSGFVATKCLLLLSKKSLTGLCNCRDV